MSRPETPPSTTPAATPRPQDRTPPGAGSSRPGGMQNPDYERLRQPGKRPEPDAGQDGDADVPGPGDGPRGPKG